MLELIDTNVMANLSSLKKMNVPAVRVDHLAPILDELGSPNVI